MFWKRTQLKKTIKNISFQKIDPAFSECDHCVVFCADDGYMALTAVAIQSIVDHAIPEEHYDILVFHGGISAEHETIYQDQWKEYQNVSIRLVNIAPLFDGLDLYTENRENFTREAYFRLATPWVLSDDYKMALYLDGDMLLRYDLSPIFDTELEEHLLGAVKDYWGICNCYMDHDPRREYRLSIGLDDIDHYVISATLLFNLALWRKKFTLQQVVELCASKNWEQHDQDVVNILCKGNVVFLSPTWGKMEDYGNIRFLPQYMQKELAEAAGDPVIAHFGGVRKPYSENYVHFDVEFWQCADRTPYMSDLLSRIPSDEYRNYVVYTVAGREGINAVPSNNGTDAFYKGEFIGKFNQGYQKYKVLKFQGNKLHVECSVGYFGLDDSDEVNLYILLNGKTIEPSGTHPETIQNEQLGKVYKSFVGIFDVPLLQFPDGKTCHSIRLTAQLNREETPLSDPVFQQYAELSGSYRNDFFSHAGWILRHSVDRRGVSVFKARRGSVIAQECRLLWEVFCVKNVIGSKKAVLLRLVSDLCRPFVGRPIWLVSDRMDKADDNGEVFYRYLKENHKADVNAFFLIRKDSPDYERIKGLGNVLAPYSWRHKLLSLLAEWSISSQTDIIYRDPFRDYGQPYRDILRKMKFVFLQHGVISNDLSRWLDKDVQEIDGLVASTQREYDSILHGNYHYTEEQVWLTGLPRFDRLIDKREKVITIMPTWRMYLFSGQDYKTGTWNLKSGFQGTRYATFYRQLMNSLRLQEAANQYGYKVQFKVHPTYQAYVSEFGFDECVNIVRPDISYAEIYSKSSLLVTDYSSAIYDFLYLMKPIVYCHFDAEEFFGGAHIYDKGSFDYEGDGFGEVTYGIEDAISTIIQYMESGCALHEPYKSRIEAIFPAREANHCEHIYQMIKLKGRK